MWQRLLPVTIALWLTIPVFADGEPEFEGPDVWLKKPGTVETAIAYLKSGPGYSGNLPFESAEVVHELSGLHYYTTYKYRVQDAPGWKVLLEKKEARLGHRLCAAFFIAGEEKSARDFIEANVTSTDLKRRNNAAVVLANLAGHSKEEIRKWSIDLMLKLLEGGKLETEGGPSPDPVDQFCGRLGVHKEKRAVPILISLVKRRVRTEDAAKALGHLGDASAGPAVLEVIESHDQLLNEQSVIGALGRLKYRPAVPVLLRRLHREAVARARGPQDGRNDVFGRSEFHSESALEALLQIGDPAAVPGLETLLKKRLSPEVQRVAKRILVQMKDKDPVPGLLVLLENEPYNYEQMSLIDALSNYRDERVVKKLSAVARESPNALVRRNAILGLRAVATRASLLELAALIDYKFPEKLEDLEGKGLPGSPEALQGFAVLGLEQVTHQKFGKDRAAWERWLRASLQSEWSPIRVSR